MTISTHKPGNKLQAVFILLMIALALIPAISMAHIVFSNGANVLSSDDVVFLKLFVGPGLDGTYQWTNFFDDVFYNSHYFLLPGLVYLLAANFAHLDVYLMLGIALGLTALRIGLIYDAFTVLSRRVWWQWALLPILSALTFSYSQITLYEHAFSATFSSLNQIGIALAIWGLVRFGQRQAGAWIMLGGGLVAAFSYSNGMAVWPALVAAVFLLHAWDRRKLVLLGSGATVSGLVYFYFLVVLHHSGENTIRTWLDPQVMVQLAGLPFANGYSISEAFRAGLVGLALLLICGCLWWAARRKISASVLAPGLFYTLTSLIGLWQVNIFRDRAAPWYTYIGMLFWIGLAGMLYTLFSATSRWEWGTAHAARLKQWAAKGWVVAPVIGVTILYCASNLTYTDKSVFLKMRSPAVASCIRAYKFAPTACENISFFWAPGRYYLFTDLAEIMAQHQLATFAPGQEWSLQGDYVLPPVRTQEINPGQIIGWQVSGSGEPASPLDYHHLNLSLPPQDKVEWTLHLPENLVSADLEVAAQVSASSKVDDGRLELAIKDGSIDEKVLFNAPISSLVEGAWTPIYSSLAGYAGQTIQISFSYLGGATSNAPVILQYPHINLHLVETRPNPTQQAGIFAIPPYKTGDVLLDTTDISTWAANNKIESVAGQAGVWMFTDGAVLSYKLPLSSCAGNMDSIVLTMGMSTNPALRALNLERRAIRLIYWLDGKSAPEDQKEFILPLYPADTLNTYQIKTSFMGISPHSTITGLALQPVYSPSGAPVRFQVTDLRLVQSSGPPRCSK